MHTTKCYLLYLCQGAGEFLEMSLGFCCNSICPEGEWAERKISVDAKINYFMCRMAILDLCTASSEIRSLYCAAGSLSDNSNRVFANGDPDFRFKATTSTSVPWVKVSPWLFVCIFSTTPVCFLVSGCDVVPWCHGDDAVQRVGQQLLVASGGHLPAQLAGHHSVQREEVLLHLPCHRLG